MSSPPYRLRVMGSPSVTDSEGKEVELSRGKPMALLAVLALESPPLPRDDLAQILWSASSRTRARGSLRQALWQLRSALGDDLIREDDPVALAEDLVETDLGELQDHLDAGRLTAAMELWGGPPFQELPVTNAPEWERWADQRRRDVERRLGEALALRGAEYRRQGATPEAIRWISQAVQVQPYRLQHRLDLAEAHLEVRAFAEARSVLAEAEETFEDADSLETLHEVSSRLDRLEKGVPLEPTPTAGKGGLRLHFTGRSGEFSALARRWSRARKGESSLGLILGEAGIGKTRLAEEVALLATSEGGRVVRVKADDSERPIEWALLVELVRELIPLSGSAGISAGTQQVLRSLLPSLPRTAPPVDDRPLAPPSLALSRTRPSAALSDALQDLVAAVSEDAPLVIIVDDLHWADGESRTVLTRAATRIVDAPILFLITSRIEGTDVSPRIVKTLNILAQSERSVRLDLEPLTEEETRTLLERTLHSPDRKALRRVVANIIRASRGNPLFVLELLKILTDEGIVTEGDQGEWVLHPDRVPSEMPLPASLRELMDRQLDQLSQSASLVAAYLARARHPVAPRVIAARSGLRQGDLTEGVGELLSRRIVQWDQSEKLAFAHDEIRAAVSRRYQLHVGLTTGGGATWSLYRTAVIISLVLLSLGAGLYAVQGGSFASAPAMGGGPILLVGADGEMLELRATVVNPQAGWGVREVSDPARALAGLPRPETTPGLIQGPTGNSEEPDSAPINISSPSGSAVLQLRAEPEGTVVGLIRTPLGRAVDEREWEAFHGAAWCDGSPLRLLVNITHPSYAGLALWEPGTGRFEEIQVPGTPGSLLACSPDGRYVAAVVADDGELRLHVADLSTGRTHPVSAAPPFHLREIHWTADPPRPRPHAVVVEGSRTMDVDWGDKIWVRAVLERSDGSTLRQEVQWESRDPQVASVTPQGRVSANRPGQTVLIASYEGWLADSVTVTVREIPEPRGVLLHALNPLSSPDNAPGLEFLQAAAVPESPNGPDMEEAVLRSVEGFSLMTGGTLEAEVTRLGEGATLGLCLTRGRPPLLVGGNPPTEATTQQPDDDAGSARVGLCGRLERSQDRFRLRLGFHPAFPPLEWEGHEDADADPVHGTESDGAVHVALSLLPDGTGIVYINRSEVARTPIRLPMGSDHIWHVAIRVYGEAGSSDRVEVGDVILWDDIRF